LMLTGLATAEVSALPAMRHSGLRERQVEEVIVRNTGGGRENTGAEPGSTPPCSIRPRSAPRVRSFTVGFAGAAGRASACSRPRASRGENAHPRHGGRRQVGPRQSGERAARTRTWMDSVRSWDAVTQSTKTTSRLRCRSNQHRLEIGAIYHSPLKLYSTCRWVKPVMRLRLRRRPQAVPRRGRIPLRARTPRTWAGSKRSVLRPIFV